MADYTVTLTEVDKQILESHKVLIDGLADYLGSGCEIVLHSLADLERSVIKIVNGGHTGRVAGAPITDLALDMLGRIKSDPNATAISYITTNRRGEPLKACTITIPGENGRIIGLLCINYYLNTPLSTVLEAFTGTFSAMPMQENFADNAGQLILQAVADSTEEVQLRQDIMPSNRNREIVRILFQRGIFNMKDAVVLVADAMGISKNTVYMHLRTLQGK